MYSRRYRKKSIIFLFKKGRMERINDLINSPSEFFYGYKELNKEYYDTKLLEEKDLKININNMFVQKLLNLLSKIFFNLPFNTICPFIFNKSYLKLNSADYIISTTNSLGITLSLAKNIGLIKANILFINMGLFSKKPKFLKLNIYKLILRKTILLTISKFEYQILNDLFKNLNIKYIPFGVDENFWFPQKKIQKKIQKKPYVLAIGNDLSRDWQFLESSWHKDFPLLKIVTSLPIKTNKENVKIIRGNWYSQALSDFEIRELYRNSEFVILTLKDTFQPSGQSTSLQAMACAKAVLITNIKGIWDRKLLKHRENIFFIKHLDKEDFYKAVCLFLKDDKLKSKIQINGRKLVEEYFNIENMKNNLKAIIEGI